MTLKLKQRVRKFRLAQAERAKTYQSHCDSKKAKIIARAERIRTR